MSFGNLLMVFLCAAALASIFVFNEGREHFGNTAALLIVVAGTVGATYLSYPGRVLRKAFRVAWNAYWVRPIPPARIIEFLVDVALVSRKEGTLSLESFEEHAEVSFLRTGLGMLVDGYTEVEIRESLTAEMNFFEKRRFEQQRVFRHMAQLAPAFGVVGSIVGLVGLLAGIGETQAILQSIPIALTSTLYGVLLGNFLFHPIAESIHSKTQEEILLYGLIIEGVLAVHREREPKSVERRLLAFLTPSERASQERSFVEIRKRYRELRQLDDEDELDETSENAPQDPARGRRTTPGLAPPSDQPGSFANPNRCKGNYGFFVEGTIHPTRSRRPVRDSHAEGSSFSRMFAGR